MFRYCCYVKLLLLLYIYIYIYIFTILSAIVQGVLEAGRIDAPYAHDDGRKWTLSDQMLAYC